MYWKTFFFLNCECVSVCVSVVVFILAMSCDIFCPYYFCRWWKNLKARIMSRFVGILVLTKSVLLILFSPRCLAIFFLCGIYVYFHHGIYAITHVFKSWWARFLSLYLVFWFSQELVDLFVVVGGQWVASCTWRWVAITLFWGCSASSVAISGACGMAFLSRKKHLFNL